MLDAGFNDPYHAGVGGQFRVTAFFYKQETNEMNSFKLGSIVAMAALTVATSAAAQDTMTLKFAHVFPSTHWHWTESGKLFAEEVTKLTGGKVQWQAYHAGQLGKEGVGVAVSGLADVSILVPSYEPAKLPLTSVGELPGAYTTSCEGTAKLWHIVKDGGALNNAEYKPLGLKVLYAIALPTYQIATSNKKVTSLEDLAGLKLRANGAAMDKTTRALGAVPVRVTSNEFYDALMRGTVDGGLWNMGTTRQAGLEKAYHYSVGGPKIGSGTTLYGMSLKIWNKLPANVQDAMMKAGAKTQKHLCEYLDAKDVSEVAWLVKEAGFTVTKLSPKEMARWNERLAPVGNDWAKEMASSGRPGSDILRAFREAPSQ